MNFQEFTGRHAQRPWGKPRLSIATGGRCFIVSRTAKELLGDPKSVVLLWDSAGRRIGMRPAECDEPNAYRMTRTSGGTASVSAGSYLTSTGLRHLGGHSFPVYLEDGVLVADIGHEDASGAA